MKRSDKRIGTNDDGGGDGDSVDNYDGCDGDGYGDGDTVARSPSSLRMFAQRLFSVELQKIEEALG